MSAPPGQESSDADQNDWTSKAAIVAGPPFSLSSFRLIDELVFAVVILVNFYICSFAPLPQDADCLSSFLDDCSLRLACKRSNCSIA